jgi:hypothetical protein
MNMRIFAVLMAALLLVAGPAYAGSNIKQKASGATVWIDQNSIEVPVGDSGLVVEISDYSTAATAAVVSHKAGKIVKVYATRTGRAANAASASSTLTISIGDGSTATFTPISAGATISTATGFVGAKASVSPADSNVDVSQGDVITVYTNGGETCGTPCEGNVTIVIE